MRLVDQGLEIVRPSVGAVGGVPQHAVIAPVATTGKIRKWHQSQRGYPARHQMIELADHGAVSAFRGKGADMGFEHDGFVPWTSPPMRGAPRVDCMIDHFAGACNVIRLKRGGWIGYIDLIVDPELVTCAGLCA